MTSSAAHVYTVDDIGLLEAQCVAFYFFGVRTDLDTDYVAHPVHCSSAGYQLPSIFFLYWHWSNSTSRRHASFNVGPLLSMWVIALRAEFDKCLYASVLMLSVTLLQD